MAIPRKLLKKSKTNKQLAGICGGLGEYLNVDPTVVRLAWILISAVTGFIPGLVVYIIVAMFVPEN